jgi:phenylalanine-4-hydroxylase
MFEEAQYFAPTATRDDGTIEVELAKSHPGFADPVYRARRNAIAALAVSHVPGSPIPTAEYTDQEHEVWALVSEALAIKHRKYATAEYLEATERLRLPAERIPQLQEVGDLLEPLTGFRYLPWCRSETSTVCWRTDSSIPRSTSGTIPRRSTHLSRT